MPHLRQEIPFVVDNDSSVLKEHVAGVEPAVVTIDSHEGGLARCFKGCSDVPERNCEVRIPVKDKEPVAEPGQSNPQSAPGPEQFWAVEGIVQFNAKIPPVAKLLLDHLA